MARELTVIVPAYNEEASLADTIRSLQNQSAPPREILVVDDFSTDRTYEVARALGATVLRPPRNTGTKAGAQNFALPQVLTPFTMAIDADTVLAPDAVAKLILALRDPEVAAACGFVVPRYTRTLWERGRYIEYLFAFTFYKPIQDYFDKPMISSGCFSLYRTQALKQNGGWQTRTMAEDMDLTWTFYSRRLAVRFVPEAVCYPIEPHDFRFMRKQLRRWSHGFVQNVRLHWRDVLDIPYLRTTLAVAVWDACVASLVFLLAVPLLTVLFGNPLFLLGYFIDAPSVLVPVLLAAARRREVGKALASFPSFFFLRIVNSVFVLAAFLTELVLRKHLSTYEKGH